MRYTELVYLELKSQIDSLRADVKSMRQEPQRKTYTLAELTALTGLTTFEIYFVSDGLKTGETTGNGTGCPCYYDPDSAKFLRLSDDIEVST